MTANGIDFAFPLHACYLQLQELNGNKLCFLFSFLMFAAAGGQWYKA